MTTAKFIEALAGILEVDADTVKPDSELRSFKLWDSTAVINLLVVFDENDIAIDEDKIRDAKTVKDLIDLAGGKIA